MGAEERRADEEDNEGAWAEESCAAGGSKCEHTCEDVSCAAKTRFVSAVASPTASLYTLERTLVVERRHSLTD